MSNQEVLLPAEAARRLGVPTRWILQAMFEKRLPRVRLGDGTLGIPSDALSTDGVFTGYTTGINRTDG
ncbi:MAG: hypothetical protein B7C54_03655 [Acidimicrobiales bacterium mtb01]|nr:MAG: hypothetical protein B7C54_03655 [Acidimicrobiales bacterium mtb01]